MNRWILICALMGAIPAWAQVYLRTQVPGKPFCVSWSTRNYTYNIHSAGSARTPGSAEFVAIDAAFQSWMNVAGECSDFRFIKGPQVATVSVGYVQGGTNANIVTFRETSCREVVPAGDLCITEDTCGNKYNCWSHSDGTIALTTTTFSFRTGNIFDSDVEFNASPHADGTNFLFTTISGPPCEPDNISPLCTASDIQNTLTHEIGHVVGLDHVDEPGATMEPSAPLGEVQKRILDPGTRAGFCETYPRGGPTPPCDAAGSLSRRVVAVNQGTAGLEGIGCNAAGGLSSAAFFGLAFMLSQLSRRRLRPRT